MAWGQDRQVLPHPDKAAPSTSIYFWPYSVLNVWDEVDRKERRRVNGGGRRFPNEAHGVYAKVLMMCWQLSPSTALIYFFYLESAMFKWICLKCVLTIKGFPPLQFEASVNHDYSWVCALYLDVFHAQLQMKHSLKSFSIIASRKPLSNTAGNTTPLS